MLIKLVEPQEVPALIQCPIVVPMIMMGLFRGFKVWGGDKDSCIEKLSQEFHYTWKFLYLYELRGFTADSWFYVKRTW